MAYIDKDYYRNTWKGQAVSDDDELDKLIDRASDIIDFLTMDQIVDITDLTDSDQSAVKKATAAQVEYLVLNPDVHMESGSMQNVTVGRFSYGLGGRDSSRNQPPQTVPPIVRSYLAKANLSYRGIRSV